MKINASNSLLNEAAYLSSPHCNERPADSSIDTIIIHGISLPPGQFENGSVEAFFTGKLNTSAHPYFETIAHLHVSSHLLISRSGKITQFVPFNLRAWHAGESMLVGRSNCNDFSIGIELEGTDDVPYEKIQYQRLTEVVRALQKTYPAITRARIVGHSDVAPGRKTDPGPSFDWAYFDCLLAVC